MLGTRCLGKSWRAGLQGDVLSLGGVLSLRPHYIMLLL